MNFEDLLLEGDLSKFSFRFHQAIDPWQIYDT